MDVVINERSLELSLSLSADENLRRSDLTNFRSQMFLGKYRQVRILRVEVVIS